MTVREQAPAADGEGPAQTGSPTWDDPGILLPQGTRLVHIGPHKTGTTGLQVALHLARGELLRQGVLYASEGRHAMSAVLSGLGMPGPWSSDQRPPPRWRWRRLVGEIRRSRADRVVLSSEFFADAGSDAIRRVIEELDPARVHVAVTLRPLARILPSQWQQSVQNLRTTPLDQWLGDVFENPDGSAGTLLWRRHRHDRLIERWAGIVGPDRVTAIVLDDRDHEMVLRVFERLLGLDDRTLKPDATSSNRSMTLPEIEVIRAFNVAYRAEKLPRRLYTRVMRFGAASLMELRPPEPDEPRIELPDWSTGQIAAASREIVEGIRGSGVRVVGDLEALAAVPPGRSGPPPDVSVSPEIAAAAAMGVLVATGLARGTGAIRVGADEGDAAAAPRPPAPVNEPFELLRISTAQLVVVILRRARAAITDRLAPLLFWRRR